MGISIARPALLVYRDLDSITELTCPVCLKSFENIKRNEGWVTSHFSPLEFSCILGFLLHASSGTWDDVGRASGITDYSQIEAITLYSEFF